MTRAVFGQRAAKEFAIPHEGVLKNHADYRKQAEARKRRARRFFAAGTVATCVIAGGAVLALEFDRICPTVLGAGRMIVRAFAI